MRYERFPVSVIGVYLNQLLEAPLLPVKCCSQGLPKTDNSLFSDLLTTTVSKEPASLIILFSLHFIQW